MQMSINKNKTLVVIGGGAAGFFTAINAAENNPRLQVLILEKTSKLLSKVKVSGGGRCNVTHACFDIAELSKKYPRGQQFVRKAFHHFFTRDTITWFEKRSVLLKTEEDGRMFPQSNSSETIIRCFLNEVTRLGIQVHLNTEVKAVDWCDDKKAFSLLLGNGSKLKADFLCVAGGGYPKLSQFQWLEKTGHTVEPPLPSLFTFNMPGNDITALMGVSVEYATVKIAGTKLQQSGPILITHWGLSGPAILKSSAWGAVELAKTKYHFTAIINWIPDYSDQLLREEWPSLRQQYGPQKMFNKNPFGLPNRLWLYFLTKCGITELQRWADINAAKQNQLIQLLTAYPAQVKGKTTFKEEFVTCGGIQLTEVDVNTMQSKKCPGLFFAGEILNVDGITGGFNFQHAWTSGWIAARAIATLADNNG